MLKGIIDFSLKNKFIVLLGTLALMLEERDQEEEALKKAESQARILETMRLLSGKTSSGSSAPKSLPSPAPDASR